MCAESVLAAHVGQYGTEANHGEVMSACLCTEALLMPIEAGVSCVTTSDPCLDSCSTIQGWEYHSQLVSHTECGSGLGLGSSYRSMTSIVENSKGNPMIVEDFQAASSEACPGASWDCHMVDQSNTESVLKLRSQTASFHEYA